jgi:hypothetical protein
MVKLVPYDPAAIDWSEVQAARKQSLEQKFLDGARLFDYACEITLAGIQRENPNANRPELIRILCDRVERLRRRENDIDE